MRIPYAVLASADEVGEARRADDVLVEVLRPDRRDLVRRRQVGGVGEDDPADVDDRGRGHHALAVDRDRLGPGQPELLDHRAQVARGDEVIELVLAGRRWFG